MFFYRICSSESSKSEGLDGKLYLSAALATEALTKGAHFSLSSNGKHFTNGCCSAWIVKENINLPDISKKYIYDFAKASCDAHIHSLNSFLSRSGVSQEEFSRLAHIDSGNLSKILSGVIYPNFKTWCRLTVALNEIDRLAHNVIGDCEYLPF